MRSDFYSNLDCETTVKSYCSFRLVFPVIAAALILFAEVEEKEDEKDKDNGKENIGEREDGETKNDNNEDMKDHKIKAEIISLFIEIYIIWKKIISIK